VFQAGYIPHKGDERCHVPLPVEFRDRQGLEYPVAAASLIIFRLLCLCHFPEYFPHACSAFFRRSEFPRIFPDEFIRRTAGQALGCFVHVKITAVDTVAHDDVGRVIQYGIRLRIL
jgi:hypothetical protein